MGSHPSCHVWIGADGAAVLVLLICKEGAGLCSEGVKKRTVSLAD